VELQPASFGVTSARTDSLALRTEIESKILCLAYKTICSTLFIELCPGYSNQPHAALDHIHQVHSDRDGNPVVSSIQSFYQQPISASRPFSSQHCAHFQDGLDPGLITGFCRLFPQHSTVQFSTPPINGRHSRKCCKLHDRPRMIFSLSLALPVKPSDYPRHFPLQPPRCRQPSHGRRIPKSSRDYTQPLLRRWRLFHGRIYPFRRGGK